MKSNVKWKNPSNFYVVLFPVALIAVIYRNVSRYRSWGGWGEKNAVKILSKMIHEVPACTELHILVSAAERICDRRTKVTTLVS